MLHVVIMKILLSLTALFVSITATFVSYEGNKVYQLHPKNEAHINFIATYSENDHFDFWSQPRLLGLPTTVMVHPESQPEFTQALFKEEIPYNVLIEDVDSVVQAERARQSQLTKVDKGRISFTEYHRLNEIQSYLQQLAEDYPDIVDFELFQSTYDANALSLVKIGQRTGDRPVIFIECGIHAREWIAPATCVYIIQELVENEDNRNMIENVDWYIIPIVNPDGYEYSHTTERLWRKTRSPNAESTCVGVDGNRNFDFHWMEEGGASNNPCSETYAGIAAFDQSETKGVRDAVTEYSDQTKLFLSIHSYGQYILYPWGYTSEVPEDADKLQELAEQIEAAIAGVNGTRYTVGSTYAVLYAASGVSPDWAKGSLGIDLSYTIELPGGGQYGFDLPASRISDVVVETFEGIKAAHSYIESNLS